MNDKTTGRIRDNAEAIGVFFQVLAFITLGATAYVSVQIAKVGTSFQVGVTQNPVVWFVVAGGIFASLMLAAVGYTLRMLSIIYDRQDRPVIAQSTFGIVSNEYAPKSQTPTSPAQSEATPIVPRPPEATPGYNPRATRKPNADPTRSSSESDATKSTEMRPKSKLWQQLTKERHFFQD